MLIGSKLLSNAEHLADCKSVSCPVSSYGVVHLGALEIHVLYSAEPLTQAELDAAEAEGGRKQVIHLESAGQLEVFPGQEVATDQTTGTRYSVSWAQDESGAITVRPFLHALHGCSAFVGHVLVNLRIRLQWNPNESSFVCCFNHAIDILQVFNWHALDNQNPQRG